MSADDTGYKLAFKEAQESFADGGIPVGSSIVSEEGKIIGHGRNQRVQTGSVILHGETSAFHNSDRKAPQSIFAGATLYTTLSPCQMCTGAILLFKIKKVVIGENEHMSGREDFLRDHGVEVVVLNDKPVTDLLSEFIKKYPDKWEF